MSKLRLALEDAGVDETYLRAYFRHSEIETADVTELRAFLLATAVER